MTEKLSERMHKLVGNSWPDEVAALEAKLEALSYWQAEAVTWLRHFENEGDHTHEGLEEFMTDALAGAEEEQEDE